MQHTVHLAHPLTRILHDQDDARQQQRIVVGTSEVVIYRQVATHDDALCPTLDIQRMRRHMVFWQVALKHATQTLADGIVALISDQGMAHRTVDSLHSSPRLSTKQSSNVAEADDEFGILSEGIKRQMAQQMSGSIATTGTHDGLDGWCSQGP